MRSLLLLLVCATLVAATTPAAPSPAPGPATDTDFYPSTTYDPMPHATVNHTLNATHYHGDDTTGIALYSALFSGVSAIFPGLVLWGTKGQ